MQLISNGTQGGTTVPTKQAAVGTPGYANSGPPGVVSPSRWDPDIANTVIHELAALVLTVGLSLDPANNTQLVTAIPLLVAMTANTWSAAQTFDNNVFVYAKGTGGASTAILGIDSANVLHMYGGSAGFIVGNNAASANNLIMDDSGNVTFRGGLTGGGFNSGGFNVEFASSTYCSGWRNDGANTYLLLTGSSGGAFNSLRPITVNDATGAMTIDGTGVGTSFGGAIYPAGGLLVGGTSNPIATTTNGCQVVAGGSMQIYSTSITPASFGVGVAGVVNAFYYGSTQVGSISTNGTGTAYNITSDAKLKIDQGRIENSGDIIDRITPRWFRWKSDAEAAAEPGFFAQQVHRVFPWAVTKGHGRVGSKSFAPWQMDASKLMPIVVAELQSLRKELKALRKQVSMLDRSVT